MDIYGGQAGYRTSVAQQMDEEYESSPRQHHFQQNSNYYDISERDERALPRESSTAAYYEPYYGGSSAKGRQSSRKTKITEKSDKKDIFLLNFKKSQ